MVEKLHSAALLVAKNKKNQGEMCITVSRLNTLNHFKKWICLHNTNNTKPHIIDGETHL